MRGDRAAHGLLAEFAEEDEVLEAARRAYAEGYRAMDGYTPYPVEGLAEALGKRRSWVPLVMLTGGVTGGVGGFYMQYYSMAVDYPLNVGGRPLVSWPSFIPITFELTVLLASISGLVGWLWFTRLPQPHHPVFNAPSFERATSDRFFLCIEACDPKFDMGGTRRFLEAQRPISVVEVEG